VYFPHTQHNDNDCGAGGDDQGDDGRPEERLIEETFTSHWWAGGGAFRGAYHVTREGYGVPRLRSYRRSIGWGVLKVLTFHEVIAIETWAVVRAETLVIHVFIAHV